MDTTSEVVGNLKLEFSVLTPKIRYPDELEVRAVFTNESTSQLRMKTLFMDLPSIVIRVRKTNGEPVHLAPPPIPPDDDGIAGRENLKSGQSIRYLYMGTNIFSGKELDPGSYEISFSYDNEFAIAGDWKGKIESGWVKFSIER